MPTKGPLFEDPDNMQGILDTLRILTSACQPDLYAYICEQGADNMFFAYRWLLVDFRREFTREEVYRLWETIWCKYRCHNFQMLVGVAIIEEYAPSLLGNEAEGRPAMGNILEFFSNLASKMNFDSILRISREKLYQMRDPEFDIPDHVRRAILEPGTPRSDPPAPAESCCHSRASPAPDPAAIAHDIVGDTAESVPLPVHDSELGARTADTFTTGLYGFYQTAGSAIVPPDPADPAGATTSLPDASANGAGEAYEAVNVWSVGRPIVYPGANAETPLAVHDSELAARTWICCVWPAFCTHTCCLDPSNGRICVRVRTLLCNIADLTGGPTVSPKQVLRSLQPQGCMGFTRQRGVPSSPPLPTQKAPPTKLPTARPPPPQPQPLPRHPAQTQWLPRKRLMYGA